MAARLASSSSLLLLGISLASCNQDQSVTPDDAAAAPDEAAVSSPSDLSFGCDLLRPVAGSEHGTGLCVVDHWCWENPLPQGNILLSVWGSRDDDVWFTGFFGTLLHWDGASYSLFPSGTSQYLSAVGGSASNDVWALGGLTALHWNGVAWSEVAFPIHYVYSVWSAGPDDAWAVGDSVSHWDGHVWQPSLNGYSTGVWGSAANDVWVVGSTGVIRHWDGRAWSASASGTTNDLQAVWGVRADDVWAVGVRGTILRWNGHAWLAFPSQTDDWLTGVWGASGSDVWVVGRSGLRHWNGATWTTFDSGYKYYGVAHLFGTSAANLWIVGGAGFGHWNGSQWKPASTGTRAFLRSVFAVAPDDVWAAGGVVLHYDGHGWSEVNLPAQDDYYSIFAASAHDVWASGGSGTIIHFDGASWSVLPSPTTSAAGPIWALNANDAWTSTDRGVWHWNGQSWTFFSTGGQVRAIWGASAKDVWLVGSDQPFLHWNGAQLTPFDHPLRGTDSWMISVWGTGADDVWSISSTRTIIHWNGRKWNISAPAMAGRLYQAWFGDANDIWALVNEDNSPSTVIAHWDGKAWTQQVDVTSAGHSGFGGIGAHDVWRVGIDGAILHRHF